MHQILIQRLTPWHHLFLLHRVSYSQRPFSRVFKYIYCLNATSLHQSAHRSVEYRPLGLVVKRITSTLPSVCYT
jgi:hypothetical protein